MKLSIRSCTYHLDIHRQENDFPTLLLLHGFMGSGHVFDHLIAPLKEFCNPITLDLIGHGRTGKPAETDRFKVSEQIRDLHEIIKQLDAGMLYLHGYSMGGRLALRYAIDHRDELKGLILESTNYGIEDKEHKTERLMLDEERARQIEKDFDYFLKEWSNLPLFNTGLSTPDDLRDIYKNVQQEQDEYAMANSLRGFGAAQMPAMKNELTELKLPTLLMAGEADEKYCRIMKEMSDLLPESHLKIVKDAGHRVHLDHADAFVEGIRQFYEDKNT